MAMDMDIEMDLDLDLDVENEAMLHNEQQGSQPERRSMIDGTTETFHKEGEADHLLRDKLHMRGLERLTSTDINAFMMEHFLSDPVPRIEWIDDTSANLVYASSDAAETALAAFAADELLNVKDLPPLQLIRGKPFPNHPDIRLQIRFAVAGDRKQRGARERSRFYLMNPEYDRGGRDHSASARSHQERSYRQRSDRGSHTYARDDPGPVKDVGFDASLYDDNNDTTAFAERDGVDSREQVHPDAPSSGGPRSLRKELFPHRTIGSGRLRDRSASPRRNNEDLASPDVGSENALSRRMQHDKGSAENRVRAHMIKVRLQESSLAKRELFPHKAGTNHHRSGAFDAADETADLFAAKMHATMFDGGNDLFPRRGGLTPRNNGNRLENRITQAGEWTSPAEGQSRDVQSKAGLSIKGAAKNAASTKEQMPSALNAGKELFSENAGKELFTERLAGRSRQRRKAEDMFR